MKDQIELINKRANDFLETIAQYKTIAYTTEIKVPNYLSVLNTVTMKITNFINFLNLNITDYTETFGGWDKLDFSEIFGSSSIGGGVFIINKNSLEIEERGTNYYNMEIDLIYKISKDENHFIDILIELAKFEFNSEEKHGEKVNLIYTKNIYERRAIAEKYAHIAGGEDYFEFWKEFWNACSDQEIIECGPIGYKWDLPDTIQQEGDKYVWV